MGKKKKKKRPLQEPKAASFGGSFGDLLKQSGVALPESKSKATVKVEAPVVEEAPESDPFDLSYHGKITIRKETRRRRGKTVTVIAGLEMSVDELMLLAQELRRSLGCGSSVEDEELLLQGDQMERVKSWLAAKGAPEIVLSGR